jgi:ammonia channel protein AmtB
VLAWINGDGWLSRLGFKETGLGSAVLLIGGTSGFVCNVMLGSRYGMFFKQKSAIEKKKPKQTAIV